MSTVLGIDTAGPVVGAALVGPGLERSWSERVVRGADAVLIPAIAQLLEEVPHLDAVAVTVGPGAFTSLRVGVATALGFAMSKGVDVVCVSSLEARAAMVEGERVLALLDARKSRVYAQTFNTHLGVTLTEAEDAALASVLPEAPFVAVGEGVKLGPDLIAEAGGTVELEADRSPAVAVAMLGRERLADAVPPHAVALAYLRGADAKTIAERR